MQIVDSSPAECETELFSTTGPPKQPDPSFNDLESICLVTSSLESIVFSMLTVEISLFADNSLLEKTEFFCTAFEQPSASSFFFFEATAPIIKKKQKKKKNRGKENINHQPNQD